MAQAESQQELPKPDPGKIIDIPVDQLLLDSENPRLVWRVNGETQFDLAKILWSEMAVDEVAWSIAENGYFRSEPLFVIIKNPEEEDPRERVYIVVEGNRRLVAVRLLRDETLRKRIGATELPFIDSKKRAGLDDLPVIVYASRDSLWTSLAFRHINGIKPWDSFSKAKYVAEVHEKYNVPLEEIARKIGDRHATVKRLYRGAKLLEQAEDQARFDREDRVRNRFYFSHLYTAADQNEFQQFLGIDPEKSLKRNPVPKPKLTELAELMVWLYGKKSQGIEPVVRKQNPDLNTLREVISKPDSLSVLRKRHSLDTAYKVAIGDCQRFRDALSSAKLELQNAKATVTTGYAGEKDLYEIISDIVLYADTIRNEMESRLDPTVLEQVSALLRRART